MNYEQWLEQYKPIKNHIDPNAGHDGVMFETYGDELAFVRAQNPLKIWTEVDCDGKLIITSGYHFCDRVGYFITEHPRQTFAEYISIVVQDDEKERRYVTKETPGIVINRSDAAFFGAQPDEYHHANDSGIAGPAYKLDVGEECNVLLDLADEDDSGDGKLAVVFRSIVERVATFEKLQLAPL